MYIGLALQGQRNPNRMDDVSWYRDLVIIVVDHSS